MNGRVLRLCIWIIRIAPIYALAGIVSTFTNLGPIVLLPIFLVFVPAGMYVLSRRCAQCGNSAFASARFKENPRLLFLPIRDLTVCPTCGSSLA